MGIFEKLGLNWMSMLFYAINFIILVVVLTLLLYKPIKRMIAAQKQRLDDVFVENKRLNVEAGELKHKYDVMLTQAKQEAMRVSAEVTEKAHEKYNDIINEAKEQADNILDNARKEAVAEHLRFRNTFKESASKLAIDIAEKVLEREVKPADNKRIIDECLNEWDKI